VVCYVHPECWPNLDNRLSPLKGEGHVVLSQQVLLSTIVAAFHCGVFDLSLVYFYMPFMYMQALAAMLIRKSLRCLASMSSTDWRGIPVADVQHL